MFAIQGSKVEMLIPERGVTLGMLSAPGKSLTWLKVAG